MCRSHCTDRPLLARAAGSITIPTGIDRLINSEAAGAIGALSFTIETGLSWELGRVPPYGQHGHTPAWQSLGQCSASASMVKPSGVCFAEVTLVDTDHCGQWGWHGALKTVATCQPPSPQSVV